MHACIELFRTHFCKRKKNIASPNKLSRSMFVDAAVRVCKQVVVVLMRSEKSSQLRKEIKRGVDAENRGFQKKKQSF